jgi:transposase
MALKLRALQAEETPKIKQLAHSRTESARKVERAKIIWYLQKGLSVPQIAVKLNLSEKSTRLWIKRFNADGLAGLEDEQRSGRPATYTPEQIGEVIAAALTNPQSLELPFGCWTLDRLAAYLNEKKHIPIKRSRIDEILLAEGLRWKTQETWFGERVDPDFAKKRGSSRPSTPPHLPAV